MRKIIIQFTWRANNKKEETKLLSKIKKYTKIIRIKEKMPFANE
jgi:hypothetical protein